LRLPTERPLGLARIAEKEIHLRRPFVTRVVLDMPAVVEVEQSERLLDEFSHTVRFARRDDEVVGGIDLHHEPHRLDVVTGEAPVTFRLEVAEEELVLQTELDASRHARDLSRDKCFANRKSTRLNSSHSQISYAVFCLKKKK